MNRYFLSLATLSIALLTLSALAAQTTTVFQRVHEPREDAFTILVPKGWITAGGIFRLDPTTQGGAMQSIAAKCDFAVKKDEAGSCMFRSLPDMLYFDMTNSPAGQMGLFPTGSNYNGMTVFPIMNAQQFISQIVVPYAHPMVSDIQLIEQKALPKLAQKCSQRTQAMGNQMGFSYDAAVVTVTYTENGVRFKERLLAVIENWGPLGQGLWGNKETAYFRAPVEEFDQMEPIVSVIQGSVQINSQWLAGELRGQMQRSEIAAQTQRDLAELDKQITDHRRTTNSEIHNDMFLTLTDQEEYVNPYTKEVEVGSNQWQHRWENQNGDIIYSNQSDYDPNHDVNLNLTGFKRSDIRPRKP